MTGKIINMTKLLIIVITITIQVQGQYLPRQPIILSHVSETNFIELSVRTEFTGFTSYYHSVKYSYRVKACTPREQGENSGHIDNFPPYTRNTREGTTQFRLTNLEEATVYNISISAVNGSGATPSPYYVASTLPWKPSLAPVVKSLIVGRANLSLAWSDIPCREKNADFTNYQVILCNKTAGNLCYRYNFLFPRLKGEITTLAPNTNYSLTITGFFFSPRQGLFGPQSAPHAFITRKYLVNGFLLMDTAYPNNSAINFTSIDQYNNTLFCTTPSISCCNQNNEAILYTGEWLFPNNTKVYSDDSRDIYSTTSQSEVVLNRWNSPKMPTGIYTCKIPDINGTIVKLYAYLFIRNITGVSPSTSFSFVMPWTRLLVITPYNALNLTCTARALVTRKYPLIVNASFTFFSNTGRGIREVARGSGQGTEVSFQYSPSVTEAGNIIYICSVRMRIVGTSSIVTDTRRITVTAHAPSFPSIPINVRSSIHQSNTVIIRWDVTMETYGPETYTVRYRKATSSDDLLTDEVTHHFVILTGIEDMTAYFYRVEATNSVGTIVTDYQSFTFSFPVTTTVSEVIKPFTKKARGHGIRLHELHYFTEFVMILHLF